jgi:predicted nucleotidyltransferase/DNA-binding XRE family transcriptional regulator
MASPRTLIREARTRARLSQAQLAARAKTSQPAIARYEAGAATPTLATLERILAASGVALVLDASRRPSRRRISGGLAVLRQSRERLQQAAERHGVHDIRIFGSIARGEETPESDVDLLVELDRNRTLLDLIGFQQEAEEILGVDVDVVASRFMKSRVRQRAQREARAL